MVTEVILFIFTCVFIYLLLLLSTFLSPVGKRDKIIVSLITVAALPRCARQRQHRRTGRYGAEECGIAAQRRFPLNPAQRVFLPTALAVLPAVAPRSGLPDALSALHRYPCRAEGLQSRCVARSAAFTLAQCARHWLLRFIALEAIWLTRKL